MLPSWGRWVNSGRNDQSLLTPTNAQVYGEFLGKRYGKKGVIWILGGTITADSTPGVGTRMMIQLPLGGG